MSEIIPTLAFGYIIVGGFLAMAALETDCSGAKVCALFLLWPILLVVYAVRGLLDVCRGL